MDNRVLPESLLVPRRAIEMETAVVSGSGTCSSYISSQNIYLLVFQDSFLPHLLRCAGLAVVMAVSLAELPRRAENFQRPLGSRGTVGLSRGESGSR